MDTPDARPLAMAERLQHRSGQDQGAPHARLTQTTVTTNDEPTRSPSGAPTPVRKRPPTRSRQNADTANTVETPTRVPVHTTNIATPSRSRKNRLTLTANRWFQA